MVVYLQIIIFLINMSFVYTEYFGLELSRKILRVLVMINISAPVPIEMSCDARRVLAGCRRLSKLPLVQLQRLSGPFVAL